MKHYTSNNARHTLAYRCKPVAKQDDWKPEADGHGSWSASKEPNIGLLTETKSTGILFSYVVVCPDPDHNQIHCSNPLYARQCFKSPAFRMLIRITRL